MAQINKNRNEKGEVTTDTTEIQRIIRANYEQLYANEMGNLGDINKFLERYNLLTLNQKEIENMNITINSSEVELSFFSFFPTNKSPGSDCFTGEFYQTFRKQLTPTLLKQLQKNLRERKTSELIL